MLKFKENTNLLYATGIFIFALLASTDSGANEMSTTKKTFYFGRYTFEVPTDSTDIWSAYKVIDKKIELISKNGKSEIITKISEAIEKIKILQESGAAEYVKTVELDGGGAIVVSKSTNYKMDIFYLTKKNTLYKQSVDSVSSRGIDMAIARARELNTLIHYRNPAERPPDGTFAIEAGYMTLPVDTFKEQVSIGLPISSIPGIHLTFDTQRIGKPEPSLLTRYEQRTSGVLTSVLSSVLSNSSVLRKSKKTVAGLSFEELLLKTNVDGRTIYSFRLEYPGTPESSMEPYTVIEMSTLDKGLGFQNDNDALRFWDELVASLKRI
ncbi:T6SS immunity protein Tli4 family protein [Pseudomonas syringae]|uniref:T6SS immunity protein Tli4 family protein n=1 Tax=Pseudomonas syringae TaxID=317 RepID=UPI001F10F957|nr:T6SS immunity protein Tli4 family protein [Pseudomonas syringae]MCH5522344.1 T6SS immunity protein Tli4 family protein [Pseudomonas syringae pv. lapsa]